MRKFLLLALFMALPVLAHAQSAPPPVSNYCMIGVNWVPCGVRSLQSTSYAGSITTGGGWQQVAPADVGRTRFFVQNYCSAQTQGIANTESIFLTLSYDQPSINPTTTPGAIEIVSCGSYDTSTLVVGPGPIWIWAATTGHRFDALEW
jgi:hypothetical protein